MQVWPGARFQSKKIVTKIVMRIVMRCNFDFEICLNFSTHEFFRSTFWRLFRHNFRYNSRHNFHYKNFTSDTGLWVPNIRFWKKSSYHEDLRLIRFFSDVEHAPREGVSEGVHVFMASAKREENAPQGTRKEGSPRGEEEEEWSL